MKVNLIDGWKHPLALNDVAWELASEDVASVVGRIPPRGHSDNHDLRVRVLMRRTGCSVDDLRRAALDDSIYLALVSRWVVVYDEFPGSV